MLRLSRCAFAALVLTACRGAGSDGQAPPPRPAARAGLLVDGGLEGVTSPRSELPSVRPLVDDPRLAKVKERLLLRDDKGAALAMSEARAAQPPGSFDACAWLYLEGRLSFLADLAPKAAAAFDEVAGMGGAPPEGAAAPALSCTLAPYALLRASQAYVRAGDGDKALARARAIPEDMVLTDEARLAMADAHFLRGDRVEAMALWRAALAASPRGLRWVESTVRLAGAMLEGVSRGEESRKETAEEALRLVTRAMVEQPRAADSLGAEILRVRALGALGKLQKGLPSLSPADTVRRAQAFVETGDGERALATLGPVLVKLKALRKEEPEVACRALTVKAQAKGRVRGAADAWGDAIEACAKSEGLPTALYHGARACLRERRPKDAEARFTKLETAFPRHRLADDARFYRATMAADEGDEARSLERMRSVADDYPQGDMAAEALFRVALSAMSKGDWAAARQPLERIETLAREAGVLRNGVPPAHEAAPGDVPAPVDTSVAAGASVAGAPVADTDAGSPDEPRTDEPRAPATEAPAAAPGTAAATSPSGAATTSLVAPSTTTPPAPAVDASVQKVRLVALERAAPRALYFLGRVAAALGDNEAARTYYRRVVDGYPLSFYMAQAYARLEALDAPYARRGFEERTARDDGSGPFLSRPYAELGTLGFERARRLLEVGDHEPAKRELSAAGLYGENAPNELVWLVGHLLDQAGFYEQGHAIGKYRMTEHWDHYPVGRWRVPWEVTFPRAFDGLVSGEAQKNGVPSSLAWAIMREESGFLAEARSTASAFGLMQLVVPTARIVARGTGLPWDDQSLRRPSVNVALGTRLLAQLRSALPAHPALPIAAYNAGAGAVGRWLQAKGQLEADLFIESIPYEETRNYVKKVLASHVAYAFLYAREGLPELLHLPRYVTRGGAGPALAGVP